MVPIKKNGRVTALGELLIDFTCLETDEHGFPNMTAHPGGAPANYLAALAKHGIHTALLAKVGEDAFGKLLIQTMMKAGICTDGIRSDASVFTTLAFVTLDDKGERTFSFARKPGADTCLTEKELDENQITEATIFHFGTLSLTDEPMKSTTQAAVAAAKAAGCWMSFDPNLRLPLWKNREEARQAMEWGLKQADMVKISDEEAEFLWGLEPIAAAEKLLTDYPIQLGFVTCGAEGAVYAGKAGIGSIPLPFSVQALDTTGAGDIFFGSATAALLSLEKQPNALSGEELSDITRHACAMAALSTTRAGGISSVPEPAVADSLCET